MIQLLDASIAAPILLLLVYPCKLPVPLMYMYNIICVAKKTAHDPYCQFEHYIKVLIGAI